MNRYSISIAVAAFAILSCSLAAHAETLLGKNYVGASYEAIQFGDDITDDIFGTVSGVSAFWNINLYTNLDLTLRGDYIGDDGSGTLLRDDGTGVPIDIDLTGMSAGANLTYAFRTDELLNPFLGIGISVVTIEYEYSGDASLQDEDDTEVGFSAGGGVEFDPTGNLLIRAGVDFFYIDSEDSFDLVGDVGYWFTEKIIGMLGVSYDPDSETSVSSVRIIYRW